MAFNDPYTQDGDDWTLDDAAAPESADAIEQANGMRVVPPGEHDLMVHSVYLSDKTKYYTVTLPDGTPAGFDAKSVTVKFCLPSDPRAFVSDFFVLPPQGTEAQRAYTEGMPDGKTEPGQRGWNSKKFWHFAERTSGEVDGQPGITVPGPNGKPVLSPRGKNPKAGWPGLRVHATVKKGRTWTGRDGQERMSEAEVGMFSYKPVGYVAPAKGGAKTAPTLPGLDGAANGPATSGQAAGTAASPGKPAGKRAGKLDPALI